jgi:hypothetical protein
MAKKKELFSLSPSPVVVVVVFSFVALVDD